jgi:plastocyanin
MLIAAAPSKVPFYIAGGLLAAWAVVIAFSGIRRPDFPSSKKGRLGVIVTSLLFVLGAVSMAVVTAGEETEADEIAAGTSEFRLVADPSGVPAYEQKSGTVESGTVTIKFVNASTVEHNVTIAQGARQLGESDTINGADTELKVDLRPGEYEYYCTVDSHRQAGMEGKLTVQ